MPDNDTSSQVLTQHDGCNTSAMDAADPCVSFAGACLQILGDLVSRLGPEMEPMLK